ncbi:FIST N-terminal domain-containing protein [uncultured Roseobacter sp.]|uniref:FIST N-terminal domain-containing protein n=1 Tax=uncultured Roseobacter sp. TaxID=114847 RepID=UPI00261F9CF9|nr:FIST N-terminal domain-containing protein [uncultured Roseobacter sp.]
MNADAGFADAANSVQPEESCALRTAQVCWSNTSPVAALYDELGAGPFSFIAIMATPSADFPSVVAEAQRIYPDTDVVACTTAGEITGAGYDEGTIVAIAFPADDFASCSIMIEGVDDLDAQSVVDQITLERIELQQRSSTFPNSFAFLVVDGLSLSEDTLSATIAPALGDTPIFGGSAGDGTDFRQTFVGLNGRVAENAAVLTLVRTRLRTKVFSLDHLVPTGQQMVVTDADPARRIVKAINAEPAAREYARIVGKDPEQLDRFTFAAHPVVVRIGDAHHVRAIQQVTENGEMVFFSAVDEGMVLTVARPQNMVTHLQEKLQELSTDGAPSDIIGCDCILRRIEAEQSQIVRAMSEVLSEHNVIGFSTYGEQIGPLHVNHTMSGVAFYPADEGDTPHVAD